VHVDGVVIGGAAEFALLGGGGIAERHAQAAADTEIDANRAHHPAITIGFLDDAAGDGTRRLTNRARKRTETKIWVDDRGGTVEKLHPNLYRAIIDEAHKNNIHVLNVAGPRQSEWPEGYDYAVRALDVFLANCSHRPVSG